MTTPSRPTKDYSKVQLDLSGIMAAYEEKQYYGNSLVKHTVTIRNGHGDIKNIDLTDIHLLIEPNKDEYLQKCMRDESISVVKTEGKVLRKF
ncbi:hypothetical protein SAMN02745248_00432 [Hathewaya proteolytica DSM 3090]|uniref:Uncharacterized protein n=1 Tax=Hathewaya proteolytica DSM 3090 TaxID=1121331 RepID=A0A1M6KDN1_9CLOT|nr:hypothetical protein [Hathewaya proteolytica]SHJ57070.1 hypothetical protein SAMN02745248_00432 [Hathewaya proteolytica DSM 3090]